MNRGRWPGTLEEERKNTMLLEGIRDYILEPRREESE